MVRQGQRGDYFRLLEQGRVRFPTKLKFLLCWGKQAAELLREDSHGHNPQATMPLKWWNKLQRAHTTKTSSRGLQKGTGVLEAEAFQAELQAVPAGWWQPELLGECWSDLSSSCRAGLRPQVSSRDLAEQPGISRREGKKHNQAGLWRPMILLTELNQRVLRLSWVTAYKRQDP